MPICSPIKRRGLLCFQQHERRPASRPRRRRHWRAHLSSHRHCWWAKTRLPHITNPLSRNTQQHRKRRRPLRRVRARNGSGYQTNPPPYLSPKPPPSFTSDQIRGCKLQKTPRFQTPRCHRHWWIRLVPDLPCCKADSWGQARNPRTELGSRICELGSFPFCRCGVCCIELHSWVLSKEEKVFGLWESSEIGIETVYF